MSTEPNDQGAGPASSLGWLGEVSPEDLERESRKFDDPYKSEPVDENDQIKIVELEVLHQRGSSRINKLLLSGLILLIASTFLQALATGPEEQKKAVVSPSPMASASEPGAKGQEELVPAAWPEVVSAVAEAKSGVVFIRIELKNESPIPSLPYQVRMELVTPEEVIQNEGLSFPSLPAKTNRVINLNTPFRSTPEFIAEQSSFSLSQEFKVDFEVKVEESADE